MSTFVDTATDAGQATEPASVKVWDPLVRIFHWSLVLAFATAWFSAEEFGALHRAAGYAVLGLLAFRLLWGLVGTRHARFADFLCRPGEVVGFLWDSIRFRARRYLGHNPAGGAMVAALLLVLVVITGTGLMMTTDAWWGIRWVREVHETAVNVALALVAVHIAGVVLASLEHGENLVKAMLTGRKRAPESD